MTKEGLLVDPVPSIMGHKLTLSGLLDLHTNSLLVSKEIKAAYILDMV